MTRKTTQKEQVEHLLRTRGEKGVHTFELHRECYIMNPSERIRELRDHDWVIDATDERFKGEAFGTRYRLISEPAVEHSRGYPPSARSASAKMVAGPPAAVLSDGQLFDVEPCSASHWEDAA